MKISAGLLLYRVRGNLEVLLAHPGGPIFATKDRGHWTIPKGEPDSEENDLEAVALREFREEIGDAARLTGKLIPLGSITQRGGKVVHGWAAEGDFDPDALVSNTFTMEWPPRSGRRIEFPEIDRADWFDPAEARRRIKEAQIPLIDRLVEYLAAGG